MEPQQFEVFKPVDELNVVLGSNSPRQQVSDSDNTIANLGKDALEQQRELEENFEQKVEVVLEKEKETEIVENENDDEEVYISKSPKENSAEGLLPQNETRISLVGRIKEGFIAVAEKVKSLIVALVNLILVKPYNFVASLFIKVGEGIVKAGKGTINFAGTVLSSAKKAVVCTAEFFAGVVKNRAVQLVSVVGFVATIIALNHEKIETQFNFKFPKLI